MSEWEQITLKQAGISLIDCDHKTPVTVTEGIPYVTIPQIKDGHINLSEARCISEEDFKIWTRKANPQTHDIVLSRRCNPGETAYVSEGMKFALGQNLVLLRSDNKTVLRPFLRWLVRSPAWWGEIKKFTNFGSVFNSLKCGEILHFNLPIPPIKEQEYIIKTLSCLDAKIENLRRQNETLEQIARSLFKHWFIDFEFPNADDKPYKSSGGAMVASELGDIPEGWKVGTLESEVEIQKGVSYKGEGLADSITGIPMHNLKSVGSSGFEGINV
jgi:type I restriction enzyme S subunit